MITYPNLYHLKYFLDAVELGSISAAAHKNLVTHPAISRAISSLEQHLGFTLLDHQRKSFKVTSKGHKVAEQAKVLLSVASDFQKLSLTDLAESITLKIGISKSLSEYYLYPLITKFKKEIPSLNIQVKFGTTNEIVGAVANGSIDLGLTIGTQVLPSLKQTSLKKGKFILVESKLKSTQSTALSEKNFILTEPRYETEKLKTDFKKKFGKNIESCLEISSWEVIRNLVMHNAGVGLLPDIVIQHKVEDLRIIKTSSWFESSYDIVLHCLKTNSNKKFIQLAFEVLDC